MAFNTSRRDFIRRSSWGGLGLSLLPFAPAAAGAPRPAKKPASPLATLQVGLIGVGLRGRDHLDLLLRRKDCVVTAICDIDPQAIAASQELIKAAGQKPATAYAQGDRDFERMLAKEELDAVIIATPWEWHSAQAISAMRSGVAVGCEVGGGFSVDECWELVNTHEATKAPFFFLENVCYRRDVLAVLNMVRQGLFGELVHLEGGYQHDLRAVKFNDGKQPYGGGVEFGAQGFSEAKWRTLHSLHRNGDLYPTHGLGPVAMMTNINRGNRLVALTSTSSKARGLPDYILHHPQGGSSHPNAQLRWQLGDVVTTVIRCNNGESILLSHDTNLPRPYSLGFRVQGTRGLWMDVNQSIYLEGRSPNAHRWEPAQPYLDRFDHPLWQKYGQDAAGAGHGGMDFFVLNSFIEGLKAQQPPQIDVYDAATWLAITPLSEASIATGGTPQAFPDFTRGRWINKVNDFARDGAY